MGIHYAKVTTDDLAMLANAVIHARDAHTAKLERLALANSQVQYAKDALSEAQRRLREATAVFTGLVNDHGGDDAEG